MTQFSSNVGEQGPCDSCSSSMEALHILAMSLHTALHAAQHICVPLPQSGLPLPFRATPSDQIPQELREVCERLGHHLSPGQSVGCTADTRSVANAPPIALHPDVTMPNAPEANDSDARSITSTSTDWDQEFGISITPTLTPTSTVATTLTTMLQVTATPSSTRDEERWYAVLVGRNPGVYSGSHTVTANVTGISGGLARRYGTEQLAQAAFDEALDLGEVVQVTHVVSRETLYC